jgi:D-amino peptidase
MAVGEVQMNAAVLGSFGVPVGLIVGNSDLEPEVRSWDRNVEFVSTKRTLGPTAAICATPGRTHSLIADAAAKVVSQNIHADLYNIGHTRIEVDTYRREQCDKASSVPGITTSGEFTIVAEADTAAKAFQLMWRACTRALDETPSWLA